MDNRIGNVLRRNRLLKHIIEGEIKVTRRRERSSKQLPDDRNEARGYCKLKGEALDRRSWQTCFGRHYGPVVGNDDYNLCRGSGGR